MSAEIKNIQPSEVWTHFYALNQVPRGSKKEERVIAFAKNFGENLGLETIVDEVGNVIIRKNATPGMEHKKTLTLQSHLDMVHQKNSDTVFNFDEDPIKMMIAGEWVKADGTTLGADNGMGVAAIMAVLASKDLAHGPIEALFTIDEETGMTGAMGLKANVLTGDILLNLDTEDEGELCIGCAGGVDTTIDMDYTEEPVPADSETFSITIKGLNGGHSGCDIHLQLGNANILMTRILWEAMKKFGLRIAAFEGGSLRNAIPREAFATVSVPAKNIADFKAYFEAMTQTLKFEYKKTEENLSIELTEGNAEWLMEANAQVAILNSLLACPNGVHKMSDDIEGLVETSSNLARVEIKNGHFNCKTLQRSSLESGKWDIANKVNACFNMIGAEVSHGGAYPGWVPNPEASILKTMKTLHNEIFNYEPKVSAVHAGLECGLLGQNYPDMEMISFGPTIRGAHSPDERVHIPAVASFWKYLVATLENAPEK